MKTFPAQDGSRKLTLRTKMLLISAAAFTGILVVVVVSMALLNEVRIGGPSYKVIKENKDALESIALLKSDLFQINSEMQNFMLEADKAVADKNEATIRNLVNDIELNFDIVLKSIESPQKREAINRAEAIWNEYKITLLDKVLPAAGKGEILKASYLMTGVQVHHFDKQPAEFLIVLLEEILKRCRFLR